VIYVWQTFDKAVVEVASSVFFRHQDSTMVWFVSARMVIFEYDEVSMLYNADGGVIMFNEEITKKPSNTKAKRIMN